MRPAIDRTSCKDDRVRCSSMDGRTHVPVVSHPSRTASLRLNRLATLFCHHGGAHVLRRFRIIDSAIQRLTVPVDQLSDQQAWAHSSPGGVA